MKYITDDVFYLLFGLRVVATFDPQYHYSNFASLFLSPRTNGMFNIFGDLYACSQWRWVVGVSGGTKFAWNLGSRGKMGSAMSC